MMAPDQSTNVPKASPHPGAQQRAAQEPGFVQQVDRIQPSRFMRLPVELQQKIFTAVVDEPYIHVVKASRGEDKNSGKWYLTFSPVSKSHDKSGFRIIQSLKLVCRTALEAMRFYERFIRRAGNQARLPFKRLGCSIDGAHDLAILDLPNAKSFGVYHPDFQFLNPTFSTFDDAQLASQISNIEKIALVWRESNKNAHDTNVHFRCADPLSLLHKHHAHWKACPEQVVGFLNCFPKLREFYIVLELARTKYQQDLIECYVKNYYTRELSLFPRPDNPPVPPFIFRASPAQRRPTHPPLPKARYLYLTSGMSC
ncbi:hypothetical protein N658DRAFT_552405 [Parathielavia hyrcaniae]|uniref:2EXR domain-containing protein n=1 Tax=Parathielavia hyrcaniae TaxID=113614 RepID=A0AAN6T380_9PEZI|nr:hypothetical protein N658DRAFT_552405 [Parathielavia hyrcaniae]